MGEPSYIQLPEMNLGPIPRRRRRPRPAPVVAGIDEPEAAPALTTDLRERDTVPEPQGDALSGIGSTADRIRARLGIGGAQDTEAALRPSAPVAPVDLGLDDEEESQAHIDTRLAGLREQRGPLAVQRAQSIPLPGAEDSPESTRAILGAIEQERTALPGIPRTQLQQPRIAPPAARGVVGARYGEPVVAGIDDDIEAEPMEEDAAGLGRPQTGMSVVEGVDDFDEEFAPTAQPKARQIPGVQPDERDQRDATMARRMNIAQGALGIASGLANLVAPRRANQGPLDMQAAMGMDQPRWSDAPNARIAQRVEQRRYDQEQAQAADDRNYERDFNEQRMGLDARRIAQGEAATQQRAGYRDADIMPDHPNAQNERTLYAAAFSALPQHIRETFPGFDPSNPSVQRAQAGLGAAQIRRQLELLDEQIKTRFPDENDWRSTTRTGGGRAPRGQLAGFTQPGRTIRRGDSGVTPEQLMQMDAGGVDEIEEGAVAPQAIQRPMGGGGRPATPRQQAPAQGQPTAAPGNWQTRNPSSDEFASLPIDVQTTVETARALRRQFIGKPWNEVIAAANGMTPEQRGATIREWGSDSTTLVPGWRRVVDTGRLTPARMDDIRTYASQARTAAALSREILEHIDRINALGLAENQLTGNREVMTALSKARRLQTLLRIVDRTGVPTGTEQQRAMEEAPEPITPMELLRSRSAYEAYPASILSVTYRNLEGEGFLPERPRGQQRPAQGSR